MKTYRHVFAFVILMLTAFTFNSHGGYAIMSARRRLAFDIAMQNKKKALSTELENLLTLMGRQLWTEGEKERFFTHRRKLALSRGGKETADVYSLFIYEHFIEPKQVVLEEKVRQSRNQKKRKSP